MLDPKFPQTISAARTTQNPLPSARGDDIITARQRAFLLSVRQALIMVLGALEDYLGMEHSIIPKRERI